MLHLLIPVQIFVSFTRKLAKYEVYRKFFPLLSNGLLMTRTLLTLCLVHESGRVLLGMKKRGFGAGRWNGFGGKVQDGESIEEAARRELQEEAGVGVRTLKKCAMLEFTFPYDEMQLEVHVFRGSGLVGEAQESDEMRPAWFAEDAIPFDQMWVDDRHWFPLFLAGKCFQGTFVFADEQNIIKMELKEEYSFT